MDPLFETQADATLHDVDPMDAGLLEGRVLDDRYQLVRRLGAGGMGVVYAARHVVLGNRFAVKVLRPPPAAQAKEATERFKREARAASALGHPNIVDVKDFGELPGGLYYYVMEHLEGRDLLAELETAGPLPTARLANVALQVAEAMGAAHGKGIVHRDLKPENVFLTAREGEPDHVKLIDFGIAKVNSLDGRLGTVPPLAALAFSSSPGRGRFTAAGIVLGTPAYMSPEQCKGGDIDFRSDLYALGVLLFEAATGEVPFEAESVFDIMRMHQEMAPPDPRVLAPDLPAPIADMILALLAKDPAQRPASMEAVASTLLPFVPGRARPTNAAIEAAIRASVVAPLRLSNPSETPLRLSLSALEGSSARASSSPPGASSAFGVAPSRSIGTSILVGAVMGLALVVGAGSVFGAVYLRRSASVTATMETPTDTLPLESAATEPEAILSFPSAPPPAEANDAEANDAEANDANSAEAPPASADPIPLVALPPARPSIRPRAVRTVAAELAPAVEGAPAVEAAPRARAEPESAHPRPTDAVRDPWAN
jgi:serine/threonine-protein kinase